MTEVQTSAAIQFGIKIRNNRHCIKMICGIGSTKKMVTLYMVCILDMQIVWEEISFHVDDTRIECKWIIAPNLMHYSPNIYSPNFNGHHQLATSSLAASQHSHTQAGITILSVIKRPPNTQGAGWAGGRYEWRRIAALVWRVPDTYSRIRWATECDIFMTSRDPSIYIIMVPNRIKPKWRTRRGAWGL